MLLKYRNSPWFIALISIVVAFLMSPDLWIKLIQGYEGDSFYTLGTIERAGLVTLTLILSAILLWVGTIKSNFLYNSPTINRLRNTTIYPEFAIPIFDILIAFGLFYLFIWLSPQVYYTYYLLIFADLPLQTVIKDGPKFIELGNLVSMSNQGSLSIDGQGLLGRALMVQIILYRIVLFTGFDKSK